jgi:hypothetical protein
MRGLGHLFPCLPAQPGYHKRLKAAAPLICKTTLYLATLCPLVGHALRVLAATPLPCGASHQTVRRSELAGWANYRYCAAHSRWYWPEALPAHHHRGHAGHLVPGRPKIGEPEVAAKLLAHARGTGALQLGMIVLADKRLAGQEMERYAAGQIQVLLARPDGKDERRRFRQPRRHAAWIGTIIDTLKGQLDLERHGGRTPEGVFTRIAQRLLAMATAIWHNSRTGASDKRSLIAYH